MQEQEPVCSFFLQCANKEPLMQFHNGSSLYKDLMIDTLSHKKVTKRIC